MALKTVILLICMVDLMTGSCPNTPPNFPSTIPLVVSNYRNWIGDRQVNNLWMAIPATAGDVVILANWANDNNFKLRASGFQHTYSPLTVTSGTNECSNYILVNTTNHLTSMDMVQGQNQVKVQTGVQMNDLLTFLESKGYGFYNYPMIGDLTVGGALAIDGHGTNHFIKNGTLPEGFQNGSLSNSIVSLTAVVWDPLTNAYILKTFLRTDEESSAFLVHLGRAFLTEVVLMVGADYNLRCISHTDISADELFSNSNTGRTISSFLDKSNSVEIMWFAFTQFPWLITRSIQPKQPWLSRKVTSPYNYLFMNTIPSQASNLIAQMTNGAWYLTPLFGQTMLEAVRAGLIATLTADIWGPSKNTLLWITPTTIPMDATGFVIQTYRNNLQNVVYKIKTFHETLVSQYASEGKFPSNYLTFWRFTGLDTSPKTGWTIPGISASRPLKDNVPFDVAIWLNFDTLPGAPYRADFMTELQSYFFSTFNDENAVCTVEWSKKWGYTSAGPFTNTTLLNTVLPKTLKAGWEFTVDTLNKYDPSHIFSNPFLDSLLTH